MFKLVPNSRLTTGVSVWIELRIQFRLWMVGWLVGWCGHLWCYIVIVWCNFFPFVPFGGFVDVESDDLNVVSIVYFWFVNVIWCSRDSTILVRKNGNKINDTIQGHQECEISFPNEASSQQIVLQIRCSGRQSQANSEKGEKERKK